MIIRFSAFHQTLTAGQIPVRFLDRLNNNYGYPVATFLYPLPFYLAEIPKALNFNFQNSVKVVFVLTTVASVFTMYWCLKQRFGRLGAFAGAALYLYVPYRFVDLYVRGSLGETVAFIFPPIVVGALYKIQKGNKLFLPVISVATALLILSHNVVALLFIPLLLVYILLLKKSKIVTVGFFLLGFAISAFFWLPALYDLQYVRLSYIKVSEVANHLVALPAMLVPVWGYGPNPNESLGMSVQLGIVTICVFIASIVLTVLTKRRNPKVIAFLLLFTGIIFLMSQYSTFIWHNVKFIDVIQFPWRLLSVVVFLSAFLAAYIVDLTKNKAVVAFLLVSAAVLSTFVYTFPRDSINFPDGYYTTNEDTTTVRKEYMPLWVKSMPTKRAEEKIVTASGVKIQNLLVKPSRYAFTSESQKDSIVRVNTIYFPGWQVTANAQSVPINYNNPQGLITFQLPKGHSNIIIKYGKTPLHFISEAISLFGILVAGLYFFHIWRQKNF